MNHGINHNSHTAPVETFTKDGWSGHLSLIWWTPVENHHPILKRLHSHYLIWYTNEIIISHQGNRHLIWYTAHVNICENEGGLFPIGFLLRIMTTHRYDDH